MKTFEELIQTLNDLKIEQKSSDWNEDLPEELWNEYFKDKYKAVKYGLNVDTHRWYEKSTEVFTLSQYPNRFIGVIYITNLFSESSSYDDCMSDIEFFEMTAVQETTYIKK